MANVNRTNQNRSLVAGAVELTSQASGNIITSGGVGLVNISGTAYIRTAAGNNLPGFSEVISVPLVLASCLSGAVPIRFSPDIASRLQSVDFQAAQVPGASGSITIQFGVGGTTMSGGLLTLTANNTSGFARVSATAITGANQVGASGEFTGTVTGNLSGAFGGGQGAVYLKLSAPL